MRRLLAWSAMLLLTCAEVASAEWLSLRSENFQVIGNANGGDLRMVALRLEQFRAVMRQLNPGLVREDSAPLVVLVFRDKASYEPFMPRANGRVVPVEGFFQGGRDMNYITLTLQAGVEGFPIVFHEYTHLLLRGVLADAPLWFNEGLAEYYSTFEVIGNNRATIGKPIQRHLTLLAARRLPFGRFFAVDRSSAEYTSESVDRSVLYAQSWAIVHHAFQGDPKRKDQLLAFIAKLTDGGLPAETFRAVYGMAVKDLELELQLYVEKNTHAYKQYNLPERVLTRIDPRPVGISDPEADAWLGDLLAHMNRQEEATARLEKALAAKPDLALAHVALGTLQMRQGRLADGMRHLERAQALGSANERAHFVYASNLIAQAPRDVDALGQARTALQRAIAIRPNYSEAKLLLGYVYLASNDAVAARDLLSPLVQLEPTNHPAALRLGEALLSLGNLDGARAVVGPVLSRATSEAERDQARRLLATVSAQQSHRSALAAAASPTVDSVPTTDSVAASNAGTNPNRPTTAGGGTTYVFRPVGTGEQRAYGIFESVECGSSGVTVVLRTSTGVLRARAANLSAIDFIAYRTLTTTSVPCGAQKPMAVYLTWRPAGAGSAEGTVVAVEILPEGFVPSP
jgi:tetratricopeptide (TPR) repeat protein